MMQEEERQDDDDVVVNIAGKMARLLISGGLDGGVISVAMHRSVIASCGREGGTRLWMVMRHRGQRRDDNVGVDDVVASWSKS